MHVGNKDEMELAVEENSELGRMSQDPYWDPYATQQTVYARPPSYQDPYAYQRPPATTMLDVYDRALAQYGAPGVSRYRRPVSIDPFNPPDRGRSRFWRTVDRYRDEIDKKILDKKDIQQVDIDRVSHLRAQAYKEDHGYSMRPSLRSAYEDQLWDYVKAEEDAVRYKRDDRYADDHHRVERVYTTEQRSRPTRDVVITTPGSGPRARMNHLEASILNKARKGGVTTSLINQYVDAATAYYKTTTKSMTKKEVKILRQRMNKQIRDKVRRKGGSVSGVLGRCSGIGEARKLKQQLQTSIAPKVASSSNTFSKLSYLGI